jgi:hypothetical protein
VSKAEDDDDIATLAEAVAVVAEVLAGQLKKAPDRAILQDAMGSLRGMAGRRRKERERDPDKPPRPGKGDRQAQREELAERAKVMTQPTEVTRQREGYLSRRRVTPSGS